MKTKPNTKGAFGVGKILSGSALLFLLWLSTAACSLATSGESIGRYENPRAALLVLDIQEDFTGKNARMPIARGSDDALLKNVNAAIRAARERGDLVIYIGNEFSSYSPANLFRNFAAIRGEPGAALDKRLDYSGGPYFAKDFPDAFSNPRLDAFLREHKVDRLTLVGVFADQCVLHTARGARNRDYSVAVLVDAVGAADGDDYRDALAQYKKYGIQATRLDAREAGK